MPKIAHISDLHFGPTFNVATWSKFRAEIIAFEPDLVVVSGDTVDHPSSFHLLAVKSELDDLCRSCKSRPELFVAPGNHDVKMWGNFRFFPFRSKQFERIMFSETDVAKKRVERTLGHNISLGMNQESQHRSLRQKFRRLDPRYSIWWNVRKENCDHRIQSCDRRKGGGQWPIQSEHNHVSIACLDSNPNWGGTLAFATGEVDVDQLTRLGSRSDPLQSSLCPQCQASRQPPGNNRSADNIFQLRVAVLHHHPLPISLARESLQSRRNAGKLEPFLVLRNSGDLLYRLQQEKFDLVLHGHKHKPQVARIDFLENGIHPYPLLVLSAGSTAKDDEHATDNVIRLVETGPSGRLLVRTLESNASVTAETYREPISLLKERMYNRALAWTKRVSSEIRWDVEVDGVGNVRDRYSTVELQALQRGECIRELPFRIILPDHGVPFEDRYRPDEDSQGLITLVWRDRDGDYHPLDSIPQDTKGGCCCVKLETPLEPGSQNKLTFGIISAAANSIAMTRWEQDEKMRNAPDEKVANRGYERIWR